jgi:TonB family protein
MRNQRVVTWVSGLSLLYSITLHGFLLNFGFYLPWYHDRTNEASIIYLVIQTETLPLLANEKSKSSEREEKTVIKASFTELTSAQLVHNAESVQETESGSVSVFTPKSLKKSIQKLISTNKSAVAASPAILENPVIVPDPIITKSNQENMKGGVSGSVSKTGSINRRGVMLKPVLKNFERPRYPSLARRHGHEGTVILEMEILEDGTVGKVAITSSSRYQELDRAAQKALENASCIPASLNGIPMRSLLKKEITFRLTD